jgi:hypothetical protein
MKVKNLTGDKGVCACGTWLAHWVKFNGKKTAVPQLCAVKDCNGNDLVGGHVKKVGTADNDTYIVPICKACNGKHGEELEIVEVYAPLAPAATSKTCGK